MLQVLCCSVYKEAIELPLNHDNDQDQLVLGLNK